MTTALLDFMPGNINSCSLQILGTTGRRTSVITLSDKSPEEIAQHESWYHDYLILKDAQRKALKEWRDEQDSHKQRCEGIDGELTGFTTPSVVNKVHHERDPSVKEKIQKWRVGNTNVGSCDGC